MNHVQIECPKCGAEIPVTEALARPIVNAERSRLDQEMRQRAAALESREKEIQGERQRLEIDQKTLAEQKAEIDQVVAQRLKTERALITAAETKRLEKQFRVQLDASERERSEQANKIAMLEKAELDYRKMSAELDEQKRQVELTVSRQMDAERGKIREQAVKDEQTRSQAALKAKDQTLAELNKRLEAAQAAELQVRKDRETVEAEKKALELEVQRRLDEERQRVREATRKEEDERNHLKLAEKDKVIEDMRKQVEELRRKSEQGSQQLQGEVQEMELEAILRGQFPKDEFEPVAVGRAGGDLIQKVIGPGGLVCGTILWESKRTKGWQDAWLAKVREDQRSTRANLGVIVSAALPKGLTSFDRVDDVWVSALDCLIPLAKALRFTLVQTAVLQLAGQDRSGKTDRMYSYVTGQDFKQRVAAIVEGFVSLRADLEREKRSVTAAWAKREKYHDLIMGGTAGMYGDLYGILGKSMPEIEGLEAPQLALPLPNDGTPPLQVHQ